MIKEHKLFKKIYLERNLNQKLDNCILITLGWINSCFFVCSLKLRWSLQKKKTNTHRPTHKMGMIIYKINFIQQNTTNKSFIKTNTSTIKTIYNSIIWIFTLISNSGNLCTCSDLYYYAEPLSMSFTLQHTRLEVKPLDLLLLSPIPYPSLLESIWLLECQYNL